MIRKINNKCQINKALKFNKIILIKKENVKIIQMKKLLKILNKIKKYF